MPGGFDFLVVGSFLFNITVEFFKTELILIVIQKCMGNGNMTVGNNNIVLGSQQHGQGTPRLFWMGCTWVY